MSDISTDDEASQSSHDGDGVVPLFWSELGIPMIEDTGLVQSCHLRCHPPLRGPETNFFRYEDNNDAEQIIGNRLTRIDGTLVDSSGNTVDDGTVEDIWPYLRDYISITRFNILCNIRIDNNENYISVLRGIVDRFGLDVRVNISLSYMLHNYLTGQKRFFYASNNTKLLNVAKDLSTAGGYQNFFDGLKINSLMQHADTTRPNSSWVVTDICSILLHLNLRPDIVAGCESLELPDYLRDSTSLCCFGPRRNGIYSNNTDNLCFFRCLAYHLDNKSITNHKHYFTQYYRHFKIDPMEFMGVNLSEMDDLELLFEVSINVYSLQPNGCVQILRKSFRDRTFTDHMYLDLYIPPRVVNIGQAEIHLNIPLGSTTKNQDVIGHYSLVTKPQAYLKKFKCQTCGMIFQTMSNYTRHVRTCNDLQVDRFPGGIFKGSLDTIFKKLDKFGIHIPEDMRYLNYRLVYDFECLLLPVEGDGSNQLQWDRLHEPVSASVVSNVPNFEIPRCFVSEGNSQNLMNDMLDYCIEVSDKTYSLQLEQYKYWFEQIEECIKELKHIECCIQDSVPDYEVLCQIYDIHPECIPDNDYSTTDEEDDCEVSDVKNRKVKKLNVLEKLKRDLEKHLRCLPVIGFNSSNYDIPAIKTLLFTRYLVSDHSPDNDDNDDSDSECIADTFEYVIQNRNSFKCLKTEKLMFLDMINYLAPGYSYANYLKAYNVNLSKGFFCYEYMDSIDRLHETTLPPHEKFYSQLKKCNITSEEYESCQEAWTREGMTTLRDYLIYYNNLDVVPFLKAIEKQFEFYKSLGVDMFRDGVTLPGLCQMILFNTLPDKVFFESVYKKDEDMYKMMRASIVGGPSLVFCRYAEVGETKIKPHLYDDANDCITILGLDANALYLWALSQQMPTGFYLRRDVETHLSPRPGRFSFSRVGIEWLSWIMHETGSYIVHACNVGEYKVGLKQIPVDGYCKDTNTVYEMLGCWFHSHATCQPLPTDLYGEEARQFRERGLRTAKKLDYINALGFNLVCKWECDFNQDISSNPQLAVFVKNLQSKNILYKNTKIESLEHAKTHVMNGDIFGFVRCDITTPDHLRNHMQEFPPIFKNTIISRSDIGEFMLNKAEQMNRLEKPERGLISSYSGTDILLTTPLLRWYLEHGLVLTKIYEIIEYTPSSCFAEFADMVSDGRRSGDLDPDKAIIADSFKLLGNSSYGRTLMNRSKFTDTKYINDDKVLRRHINNPRFIQMNGLTDIITEVTLLKHRVNHDLPIQIGLFVYQYAKLRLLEFYYDFLAKYIEDRKFELLEIDTDSFYMALSGDNIDGLIKTELRDEYELDKHNWFPRNDTTENAAFDKRKPGLFKVEWKGECLVALSSKCYLGDSVDYVKKQVCKGVNKAQNIYNIDQYLSVITDDRVIRCKNSGFRTHENRIYTYYLDKLGLSGFYVKRRVHDDGIHTSPLDI